MTNPFTARNTTPALSDKSANYSAVISDVAARLTQPTEELRLNKILSVLVSFQNKIKITFQLGNVVGVGNKLMLRSYKVCQCFAYSFFTF